MGEFVLFLTFFMCLGLFYVAHKYFGKHELYILTILFSVISFISSFKLVRIFGFDINISIVFISAILMVLYYFINRFNKAETEKFIFTIIISTLLLELLFIIISLMMPSVYDKNLILFSKMIFDNYSILIFYPIQLILLLFLSRFAFRELKKIKEFKIVKTVLAFIGIAFTGVFTFLYFSYAIIIRFDEALFIALDNYFLMTILIISYYFITNRIMKVKKVES